MSELKKNRIAAAVTVNVIILIVILAVAAVYTMAQVVIKAKQEKALRAEIARYKQLIAEGEKTLEDLQSGFFSRIRVIKLYYENFRNRYRFQFRPPCTCVGRKNFI